MANLCERVSRAKRIHNIVVAVPPNDWKEIASAVDGCKVAVEDYECPENDLVARHLMAAEDWGADIIVRIPSDNPMVEPEYIDRAVEMYLDGKHIFYTNTTGHVRKRLVDGVGAEVFSLTRLKLLDKLTQGQPELREHPHKWFYDANIAWLPDADIRFDVNTQADYDFIKGIYDHFQNNEFHVRDVLSYLNG